jgi:hypothetical protein
MLGNGNKVLPMEVPIIGAGKALGTAKAGTQCCGLVRKLDENGLMDVKLVSGPNGERMPLLQRSDYLDSNELLEAIRLVVREELGRMMTMVIDEVERQRKHE